MALNINMFLEIKIQNVLRADDKNLWSRGSNTARPGAQYSPIPDLRKTPPGSAPPTSPGLSSGPRLLLQASRQLRVQQAEGQRGGQRPAG